MTGSIVKIRVRGTRANLRSGQPIGNLPIATIGKSIDVETSPPDMRDSRWLKVLVLRAQILALKALTQLMPRAFCRQTS